MKQLEQTNISELDYHRITKAIRKEFHITDDDILTISVKEEKGRKVEVANDEYYHIDKLLVFRFPINEYIENHRSVMNIPILTTYKFVKDNKLPYNIRLEPYFREDK